MPPTSAPVIAKAATVKALSKFFSPLNVGASAEISQATIQTEISPSTMPISAMLSASKKLKRIVTGPALTPQSIPPISDASADRPASGIR